MKIQRLTARNMTSALKEVHRQLGSEAVILETKATMAGDEGHPGVMVLAAIDRHYESPGDAPVRRELKSRPGALPRSVPREPDPPAAAGGISAAEAERLRNRLHYLSRLVSSDHFSHIPIPLRELYLDLISAEMDSNLVFSLLQVVADQGPVDLCSNLDLAPLRKRLQALLPEPETLPGDRRERVLLFVGPPGAGKTVVTAGVAARCLRQGFRPGLVSLDTFRAGGPVTLEQYARVLGVPFTTAFEPEDLASGAPEDLAACDILLVDTPAWTQRDPDALEHVRRFQAALTLPEAHLVLPATSKVGDMVAAQETFRPLGLSSLVFTRIDETKSYGGMLSLSIKTRLPVSLLGEGRDILQDLRETSRDELVSLVLTRCATKEWIGATPVPQPLGQDG